MNCDVMAGRHTRQASCGSALAHLFAVKAKVDTVRLLAGQAGYVHCVLQAAPPGGAEHGCSTGQRKGAPVAAHANGHSADGKPVLFSRLGPKVLSRDERTGKRQRHTPKRHAATQRRGETHRLLNVRLPSVAGTAPAPRNAPRQLAPRGSRPHHMTKAAYR